MERPDIFVHGKAFVTDGLGEWDDVIPPQYPIQIGERFLRPTTGIYFFNEDIGAPDDQFVVQSVDTGQAHYHAGDGLLVYRLLKEDEQMTGEAEILPREGLLENGDTVFVHPNGLLKVDEDVDPFLRLDVVMPSADRE